MRAWLNLRHVESERADIFTRGLEHLGYTVVRGVTTEPLPGDMLVTWNRIGPGETAACAFEARGLPVIVAENAIWGNDFAGQQWLTLARNHHNTAGRFPVGTVKRWDDLHVKLEPWRTGGETVVLPQRGLGSPPTAMPRDWPGAVQGRVRPHPGMRAAVPLRDDLANAGKVITWGSGAAVKALMWGIPVESYMPGWIAEQNNTTAGRLRMFQRIAWAQVTLAEIESGVAFKRLLKWKFW
jgi:hypothetical protein